jgi:hypothetical protein
MRNLVRAWLSYGRDVHPGQDAWLFMIDLDAFIMNISISLQSVLEAAKAAHGGLPLEVIIANDCNGINSGVLLLRMSKWSLDFLDQMWETNNPEIPFMKVWWEQAAIMHLLRKHAELKMHVAVMPPRVLNSYPPAFAARMGGDPCWGSWHEGDFVLHFVDSSKRTDMQGYVPPYKQCDQGSHAPESVVNDMGLGQRFGVRRHGLGGPRCAANLVGPASARCSSGT